MEEGVFRKQADPPSAARPGTLARVGRIPEAIWAPVTSFALLAVIGSLGLAVGQPWIFPSLGPSAHLQSATPTLPSARMYNLLVGHLVGIAAAYAAIYLLGANDAPPVLSTLHLTPVRVFAAAFAVFLTLLVGILLKAPHPPAAATTLILALGGLQGLRGLAALLAGIALLAVLGEAARVVRTKGIAAAQAGEAAGEKPSPAAGDQRAARPRG